MISMKLAALCSGGKDSTYALWLALRQEHELAYLVAMQPAREGSWMFHYPNIHLMDLFSECVALPLVKAETSGVKEQELEDLRETLRPLEVEGVVSGAIASTYQKSRIDRICKELGLESLTPLWGREPLELLNEMLAAGFEIIITSVSAEGFDETWLGRKIDRGCLKDLRMLQEKFGINPSGEGGEYESLVLDASFFRKRIEPLKLEQVWRGDSGHLIVSKARLEEKS
ncbi:MAG: TIGR00289 family protein [Candidatus Hadarchaeota archaeon]|nr:TIGR00289 family protein [Candidatus Hadarchaeota archaeon]